MNPNPMAAAAVLRGLALLLQGPELDRKALEKGMWERMKEFASRIPGSDKRWDEAEEQGLLDVDKTIEIGKEYCQRKKMPLTVEAILEVHAYRVSVIERGPNADLSDANAANFPIR
ncbi:hypothetical protein MIND_01108400 [Mycena indigotica]|uniref:Uncharacterized protein n=1 Tax=Mycena indigotica TaxID=2126181 RepID=A0A8H6VXN3_9AGAR|nr:uncharacterized protein MIND_01108400 [Mycena indigotica]KAF7295681.1 hypothetical protein MIND_01108400 [Mycena indigotica]